MSDSEAWLIQCDETLAIAVGDQEVVEIVREQFVNSVPDAPAWCASVIDWHGKQLPVIDLSVLHGSPGARRSGSYLCVLRYQDAPGAPIEHLALRIAQTPLRIRVADSQLCDWPAEFNSSRLRPISPCCVEHEDQKVLMIDISRLCSAEFRDLALAG